MIHRRPNQTRLCMSEGLLQSRGPAGVCQGDRGTDICSPGGHAVASVLLEVKSVCTMEPVDCRSGPPEASKPTGRDHSTVHHHHQHPSEETWIKDLLRMALPTRASPSFPYSLSLPPRSLYKPLILILQRADRRDKNYDHTASKMKITITES